MLRTDLDTMARCRATCQINFHQNLVLCSNVNSFTTELTLGEQENKDGKQ